MLSFVSENHSFVVLFMRSNVHKKFYFQFKHLQIFPFWKRWSVVFVQTHGLTV